MAILPLFYKDILVLDRNAHRKASVVAPGETYGFARASHLVPALMAEMSLGCRDMPIVFVEEDNTFSPVFMVGMRSGENRFVDAAGAWSGLHPPAYLRRFPFIGGDVSKAEQVICLDKSFVDESGSTGQSLFTDESEPAEALQRAMVFVRDYALAAAATADFMSALKHHGLLHTVTIDIRSPSGTASNFSGLFAVNEDKLKALSGKAFLDLRNKGYLAPIQAHLISLANFGILGEN